LIFSFFLPKIEGNLHYEKCDFTTAMFNFNLNYFLGRRSQRGRGPPGGPGRPARLSFWQLGDGPF